MGAKMAENSYDFYAIHVLLCHRVRGCFATASVFLNHQKRFQDVLPEAQSDHLGRHTLTFQLFFPEEV